MKTLMMTFFYGIVAKTFFRKDNFDFINFYEMKIELTKEDIDNALDEWR